MPSVMASPILDVTGLLPLDSESGFSKETPCSPETAEAGHILARILHEKSPSFFLQEAQEGQLRALA